MFEKKKLQLKKILEETDSGTLPRLPNFGNSGRSIFIRKTFPNIT